MDEEKSLKWKTRVKDLIKEAKELGIDPDEEDYYHVEFDRSVIVGPGKYDAAFCDFYLKSTLNDLIERLKSVVEFPTQVDVDIEGTEESFGVILSQVERYIGHLIFYSIFPDEFFKNKVHANATIFFVDKRGFPYPIEYFSDGGNKRGILGVKRFSDDWSTALSLIWGLLVLEEDEITYFYQEKWKARTSPDVCVKYNLENVNPSDELTGEEMSKMIYFLLNNKINWIEWGRRGCMSLFGMT